MKNPRIRYLALVLLETIVKKCEKSFSEVAVDRLLDEMVKLIEDPYTVVNYQNNALVLIEAWEESSNELHYLPVYQEICKVDTKTYIYHPVSDTSIHTLFMIKKITQVFFHFLLTT